MLDLSTLDFANPLTWITAPIVTFAHAIYPIIKPVIDHTFGEMTGPQIFWTVIALLGLYQLVAIKWRLIDLARSNNVPRSFMSVPRLNLANTMSRRNMSNDNIPPFGRNNSRRDMHTSPYQAYVNGQDNPDIPDAYRTAGHRERANTIGHAG